MLSFPRQDVGPCRVVDVQSSGWCVGSACPGVRTGCLPGGCVLPGEGLFAGPGAGVWVPRRGAAGPSSLWTALPGLLTLPAGGGMQGGHWEPTFPAAG